MAIDTETRDGPGWWLMKLARLLEQRQPRLTALRDRYEGNPPVPVGTEHMRRAYRELQKKARTNFAELAVEAVRERMLIAGFRTAADDDATGDALAREVWDENAGPVLAADVHEDMLCLGDGYVIVGPPLEGESIPVITAEDPTQVVTVHDPMRPRVVRAGAKFFHDPDEEADYAYLYLPNRVVVARRPIKRRPGTEANVRFHRGWEWSEDHGGEEGQELGYDGVPVFRFRNRRGVGQFEPHVDLLDRINHQILQRVVIATMQAFRQRAIKGELPTHDENGHEIDYDRVFTADPGALWELPEGVDLWESTPVDLTGVLQAVKDDVQHFAAVTRVPMHVFYPEAAQGSAEGASLSREGLVFMAEDRIARATESWRDVMACAFAYMGDEERANRSRIGVLWVPPERRSLAENADAASKLVNVMPWRTMMTHVMQMAPAEVDRMEAERAADLVAAAALIPPAAGSPVSSTAVDVTEVEDDGDGNA